jgi:hypothetical protein
MPGPPQPACRLFWFAAYWLAGIAAVGTLALLIRAAIG